MVEILMAKENIEMMKAKPLNWQRWLKDADQYMKAATPKGEKSRFGPEIRYNLLSLSLEGYIMAILDFHHQLPDNHTYTDLITALETVWPVTESLKTRILQYENIQSICSVEKYHRSSPSTTELKDLKEAIAEIAVIAHSICVH